MVGACQIATSADQTLKITRDAGVRFAAVTREQYMA